MPDDSVISISVGTLLLGLGGILIRWHFLTWREHQEDPALNDREWRFFRSQFRRRLQTSGLLVLLGILIPVGDIFVPWQRFPRMFGLFWFAVLLLACWIMLLAALDWLATRVYTRLNNSALSNLLRKQQELEAEVEQLRNRNRANGGEIRGD